MHYRGDRWCGAGRSGGLARQFPHVWRQGNACGLEDAADHAFDVGAGDDALAVFLDDGLLQPIKVSQQVLPFGPEALGGAEHGELLLQHQREEGAEHVAADGGVRGVVDRPRAQH